MSRSYAYNHLRTVKHGQCRPDLRVLARSESHSHRGFKKIYIRADWDNETSYYYIYAGEAVRFKRWLVETTGKDYRVRVCNSSGLIKRRGLK